MSCPACGQLLTPGAARCPSCGTLIAPPLEGALAPDPAVSRTKLEPLREIPGARKREPTWKDEVRERVRHRRRERSGGDLPLFPDDEGTAPEAPLVAITGESEPRASEATVVELEDDPLDLPLRDTREAALPAAAIADDKRSAFEELPGEDELAAEDELPALPRIDSLYAIERPAGPLERAQAAVLDLGVVVGLWALVVYFASRAAHTSLAGLAPSWRWLAIYLAGLGLGYAAYFTGVTGQTLGKLAFGLRVVTTDGQPPGPLKALGRAVLGVVGIVAAFAGLLPILFDPAKRALHDRLLRTRVVKG
jgi:uncharacterized RDD family membrane protein YckC